MILRTIALASLLLAAFPASAQQQKVINYVIVDGGKYKGEELKWAASHPNMVLLGMDVLKRFRIFQGQDSMQLQRIN